MKFHQNGNQENIMWKKSKKAEKESSTIDDSVNLLGTSNASHLGHNSENNVKYTSLNTNDFSEIIGQEIRSQKTDEKICENTENELVIENDTVNTFPDLADKQRSYPHFKNLMK